MPIEVKIVGTDLQTFIKRNELARDRGDQRPERFAVGEKVSIHGHRHKDPNHLEVKTERVTWNGKVYNVYPDRT